MVIPDLLREAGLLSKLLTYLDIIEKKKDQSLVKGSCITSFRPVRYSIINTTYVVVPPLNDLEEERGAVLRVLGEDLQQVAVVVVVYEDVQPLQLVDALGHADLALLQTLPDDVVVY